MKKTYVKPEYKVFEIDRQVMLAGSVNAVIEGDSNGIDFGNGTEEGGIISID